MLRDLLYEENSFGVFVLVTVVLGGGAAWLAGRAVASMWSRGWLVLFYALLIGGAVRFISFFSFWRDISVAALLRGRHPRSRSPSALRASGSPARARWRANTASCGVRTPDRGREYCAIAT
jgi:hypothetical protein